MDTVKSIADMSADDREKFKTMGGLLVEYMNIFSAFAAATGNTQHLHMAIEIARSMNVLDPDEYTTDWLDWVEVQINTEWIMANINLVTAFGVFPPDTVGVIRHSYMDGIMFSKKINHVERLEDAIVGVGPFNQCISTLPPEGVHPSQAGLFLPPYSLVSVACEGVTVRDNLDMVTTIGVIWNDKPLVYHFSRNGRNHYVGVVKTVAENSLSYDYRFRPVAGGNEGISVKFPGLLEEIKPAIWGFAASDETRKPLWYDADNKKWLYEGPPGDFFKDRDKY